MSGKRNTLVIAPDGSLVPEVKGDSEWLNEWRKLGPEFEPLATAALEHDCYVRGISDRENSTYLAIIFVWEMSSTSESHFTTGYFTSVSDAIEFSILVFNDKEFQMNLLKSTKLFPNYRGVMLKEQRLKLVMNGKVNITEMRDGADARVEIFFTNSDKSVVINRNQALKLIDLYGGETEDWNGKPCVIYGEHGTWFGKETWGIRVDLEQTKSADQYQRRQLQGNGIAAQTPLIKESGKPEPGAFE